MTPCEAVGHPRVCGCKLHNIVPAGDASVWGGFLAICPFRCGWAPRMVHATEQQAANTITLHLVACPGNPESSRWRRDPEGFTVGLTADEYIRRILRDTPTRPSYRRLRTLEETMQDHFEKDLYNDTD